MTSASHSKFVINNSKFKVLLFSHLLHFELGYHFMLIALGKHPKWRGDTSPRKTSPPAHLQPGVLLPSTEPISLDQKEKTAWDFSHAVFFIPIGQAYFLSLSPFLALDLVVEVFFAVVFFRPPPRPFLGFF